MFPEIYFSVFKYKKEAKVKFFSLRAFQKKESELKFNQVTRYNWLIIKALHTNCHSAVLYICRMQAFLRLVFSQLCFELRRTTTDVLEAQKFPPIFDPL